MVLYLCPFFLVVEMTRRPLELSLPGFESWQRRGFLFPVRTEGQMTWLCCGIAALLGNRAVSLPRSAHTTTQQREDNLHNAHS